MLLGLHAGSAMIGVIDTTISKPGVGAAGLGASGMAETAVISKPTRGAASWPGDGRAPLRVRIAVICVVLIPLLGLVGAIALLWGAPFYWYYLAMLGGMYVITSLGIGVGYHRLFTHRAFETNRVIRFMLGVMGSMAVEGSLIKWVATHRQHHQHTDEPGDPHSPHVGHEPGEASTFLDVLRGAWHAHAGWFFDPDSPDLPKYVPDLMRDPVARFVSKTFVLWAVLSFLIPAVLGGLLTGTWMGVLQGFLWGGLVRVALVHHITWSINSVCHLWGSRPFDTGDESRDNAIFGILAFGEGWHNAHHAFPASARHGLAWWKLDINYMVIWSLKLLRLARNVRLPSAERIARQRRGAKVSAGSEATTPAAAA